MEHDGLELIRFCPNCLSASVDYSELEGGDAKCNACNWSGSNSELTVMPVKSAYTGREEMLLDMMRDLKVIVSKNASKDIASFLFKWGFIDEKTIKSSAFRTVLSKYMSSIITSILIGLMDASIDRYMDGRTIRSFDDKRN